MKGKRGLVIAVALVLAGLLGVAGVGTALAWGPLGGMMAGRGFGGLMAGVGPNGAAGGAACPGQAMMGTWPGGTVQTGEPISLDQALQAVQAYVTSTGNTDLVVDEVMEFQNNFYAVVKEKSSGVGAFELLVDRYSGNVFPEMGPNMMWNTKYGMMSGGGMMGNGAGGMMSGMMGNGTGGMMGGGMMGNGMMGGQYGQPSLATTGPMTVTADQAMTAAQQWLDQNQPGSTTEAPDQFYGYYTIHSLKDGQVTGMLSVNGYTGQVWYHTWHGAFIQMKELGG